MQDEPLTIAELVALLVAEPDQHRPVRCTAEAGQIKVPICGVASSSSDELLLFGK